MMFWEITNKEKRKLRYEFLILKNSILYGHNALASPQILISRIKHTSFAIKLTN